MATNTCFNLKMSFCCLIVLLYSLNAAGESCISSMTKKNLGPAATCLFQLDKVLKKGNDVSDTVELTLSKAQKYMDGQCPMTRAPSHYEYYCCSSTIHLKCVQCCSGSRPKSSTLYFQSSKSSKTVYWLAPVVIVSVVVIGVCVWILVRKRKGTEEGVNPAPLKV
ncbi:uncharacterized protein LOC126660810 [Mercurialis annua]|uniref:uncharacterized protein LOC126660810 n=1 Tax=Mercurialis annua TaxID=3986 RepID=UPI00215F200A|nr:uncharacterized protein LOC126660810 [Mercurialis annua]